MLHIYTQTEYCALISNQTAFFNSFQCLKILRKYFINKYEILYMFAKLKPWTRQWKYQKTSAMEWIDPSGSHKSLNAPRTLGTTLAYCIGPLSTSAGEEEEEEFVFIWPLFQNNPHLHVTHVTHR